MVKTPSRRTLYNPYEYNERVWLGSVGCPAQAPATVDPFASYQIHHKHSWTSGVILLNQGLTLNVPLRLARPWGSTSLAGGLAAVLPVKPMQANMGLAEGSLPKLENGVILPYCSSASRLENVAAQGATRDAAVALEPSVRSSCRGSCADKIVGASSASCQVHGLR